jgi:hypothetical protein
MGKRKLVVLVGWNAVWRAAWENKLEIVLVRGGMESCGDDKDAENQGKKRALPLPTGVSSCYSVGLRRPK